MNKTIAISNHKGGVGKTTTALNVGCYLAKEGYQVLLLDLDFQSNLTRNLMADSIVGKTLVDAFSAGIPIPVYQTAFKNLSISPSTEQMSSIDGFLSNKMVDREYTLFDILAPVRDQYDFILLDCPPALNNITVNALVAATDAIIPTTLDNYSFQGVQRISETIAAIQRRMNKNLEVLGVLISRPEKTVLDRKLQEILQSSNLSKKIFNTKIRKSVKQREAAALQDVVCNYAPESTVAIDYQELTKEILKIYEQQKS